MSKLTPEQSADVVRFYHTANNKEAQRNGWKDKISLGQSALQTMRDSHSILPADDSGEKKPLLTAQEQLEGVEYLREEKERKARFARYMASPPRTDDDRDPRERAAGEHFDQD